MNNCEVCNLKIHDEYSWSYHIAGKRHQQNLRKAEMAQRREDCGVYVGRLPPNVDGILLKNFFSKYGPLIDFFYNGNKNFILMMYRDREAAQNLLRSPVFIHGKRLLIRAQRPPPVKANNSAPALEQRPLTGVEHKRVKEILSSSGTLEMLIQELEQSSDDTKQHVQLCQHLEDTFRPQFPGCTAHVFGSTVTGLAMKGSDLDVFLDVQSFCFPTQKDFVKIGRKLMYQKKSIFTNIVGIPNAKIPILKFVHHPTQISCDVSFKNSFGVYNSNLIQFYISLDPRIRPYLMIIKYWAKIHELTGSGKMSNYALIMMSLFNLQQLDKPVIPSVHELQSACTQDDAVNGWICKFNDNPLSVKPTINKDSIFELLHGFFLFYSEFDYGESVISPLSGTPISKSLFAAPEHLPDALHWYKQKNKELKVISDMCVQDPFELTHNVTKGLYSKFVKHFKSCCQVGKKICENILKESAFVRVSLLVKLFDESVKPVKKQYNLSETRMQLEIPAGPFLTLGLFLDAETKELQGDNIKDVVTGKWFTLVYRLVVELLQKVIKCTVHEEQSEKSASKVQKVEEPSDVHFKLGDVKAVFCEGFHDIWASRRKIVKKLKLPPNLYLISAEEQISDALIDINNPLKLDKPLLKFNCTLELKRDPILVTLVFLDKGSHDKSFTAVMSLLQARLPDWIEKCMKYLLKERQNETGAIQADSA